MRFGHWLWLRQRLCHLPSIVCPAAGVWNLQFIHTCWSQVPTSVRVCLFSFLYYVAHSMIEDLEADVMVVRVCCIVQQLVAAAGGSFSRLEPSAQALVQAAVKRSLLASSSSPSDPAILSLITTVPLLHVEDYETVLEKYTSGACLLWRVGGWLVSELIDLLFG